MCLCWQLTPQTRSGLLMHHRKLCVVNNKVREMLVPPDSPENTGDKNAEARRRLLWLLCLCPIIKKAFKAAHKHCKMISWMISKKKVVFFSKDSRLHLGLEHEEIHCKIEKVSRPQNFSRTYSIKKIARSSAN